MVGKIEIGMLVHKDHNQLEVWLAKILTAFFALGTVKIAKVR